MPGSPSLGQGVTFGVVTEVNEDNPLLVKVSLDDLLLVDDTATVNSGWFEVLALGAGPMRGFYQPPRVADRVVVAFYNGDLSRGVVLGTLWGPADPKGEETFTPPAADKDGARSITTWASTSPDGKKLGHHIILDDTKDKEAIHIVDKTGKNSIVIDSKNNALTVAIEGDVTLTAKTSLTFTGKDADVTFTCNSFTVDAGGDITLGGANITHEASSTLTLQGDGGVKVAGETDINSGALKVSK